MQTIQVCIRSVKSDRKEDGIFLVKDKRADILSRNIVGQLRARQGWQMALDLDKQLGCVHLAKIPLIRHPPVTAASASQK